MQILGFVNRVQDVEATVDLDRFTMAEVESNAVRCPDTDAAERMYDGETLRSGFSAQSGMQLTVVTLQILQSRLLS